MLVLYLIIVTVFYFGAKIILNITVQKYGNLFYKDFSAAGFAYDSKKDIFYSTKNAWQKNFGYTHAYDVLAPLFRMIIDTQPVRFSYNNKNWLLTFWKGQYGIVTGAEIGIYAPNKKNINKKTIYLPVKDEEMLDMEFTLLKKRKVITMIFARHWWLAVFKLGMFNKPKHLTMDIKIIFPNTEMLEAFLKSFKKLKYKTKYYHVEGNIFYFKYTKPKTQKVWTRIFIFDYFRQRANRKNVKLYNKYLSDIVDDNKIRENTTNKKQTKLNDLLPEIIKNNSEKVQEQKRIMEKIISFSENKNVILLNNKVFHRTRVNKK